MLNILFAACFIFCLQRALYFVCIIFCLQRALYFVCRVRYILFVVRIIFCSYIFYLQRVNVLFVRRFKLDKCFILCLQ